MIKYSLVCESGHQFDGWFSNSVAFDEQSGGGHVNCPACGSARVSKALMAPHVATGRRHPAEPGAASPLSREALALLRKVRRLVKEHAEYVGPRFAEEARRMHYDEIQRRSIYGEATIDEARELKEEGVEIHPLACLPEDHN